MKKYLLPTLIYLSLFTSCSQKEEPFSREQMLKEIYHSSIVPAFNNFRSECEELKKSISSYSIDPNGENLELCRQQWIKVILSWRQCDIYNVGEYRKSFIKAKIYSIFGKSSFNSQKEKLANIQSLESLGSTVKGLSALEYLLFDENVERGKFLHYLTLVAAELSDLANQSVKIWENSEESFVQNSDLSFGSTIQELVNDQVRYCEEFYFKKFAYPLGYLYSIDFSIVEHYESRIAVLALKESVKVLEEYFTNHFFDLIRNQNKNSKLPEEMTQQFAAVKAALAKLETLPYYEDSVPPELESLFADLRKLFISVKVGVVNQLGVTVVLPNDGD